LVAVVASGLDAAWLFGERFSNGGTRFRQPVHSTLRQPLGKNKTASLVTPGRSEADGN
jgi:hypothetical protein